MEEITLAEQTINETVWRLVRTECDAKTKRQKLEVRKGQGFGQLFDYALTTDIAVADYDASFDESLVLAHPVLSCQNWLLHYLLNKTDDETMLATLPIVMDRIRVGLMMSVKIHECWWEWSAVLEALTVAQDESFTWIKENNDAVIRLLSTKPLGAFLGEEVLTFSISAAKVPLPPSTCLNELRQLPVNELMPILKLAGFDEKRSHELSGSLSDSTLRLLSETPANRVLDQLLSSWPIEWWLTL